MKYYAKDFIPKERQSDDENRRYYGVAEYVFGWYLEKISGLINDPYDVYGSELNKRKLRRQDVTDDDCEQPNDKSVTDKNIEVFFADIGCEVVFGQKDD